MIWAGTFPSPQDSLHLGACQGSPTHKAAVAGAGLCGRMSAEVNSLLYEVMTSLTQQQHVKAYANPRAGQNAHLC